MDLIKVKLWRRLAAALYDSLLLLALFFVMGWVVVILNHGEAVAGPWLFWLLFGTAWAFFVTFWCTSGQTLGMLVWKIRVVTEDSGRLSLQQASVRMFVALFSWAVLGAGFLWCLVDKDGRAWHDRLSQTKLVFHDSKKTNR